MSKKHNHHQRGVQTTAPTRGLIHQGGPGRQSMDTPARVERIQALLDEDRLAEALPLLEALAAREGRRAPVVWQMLASVQHDLEQWEPYLRSVTRLVELMPNEPTLQLALVEAHVTRDHLATAIQVLRRFLARWPLHAETENARQMLRAIEPEVSARLALGGLTLEQGIEPSVQHERALDALAKNQYVEARHLEEQAIRLEPRFLPALNTIGLIYYLEGRSPAAISMARRVLDQDAENVHALSNLIRFLVVSGHRDDALALAPRLRAAPLVASESWVKKAEAWSFLGDDAALFRLLADAEPRPRQSEGDPAAPMGLHLAAVAAWRLDHPQKARALWRRALAIEPAFALARENLDDLAKPVSERHAPWPYAVNYWIDERVIQSLRTLAGELDKPDIGERVAHALRMLAAAHPEIVALIPTLLDRGDPHGRAFALHTAIAMDTPEMRLALRDFALGQHGPDSLRMQAAQFVSQAGLFPDHKARLWLNGQWTELLLYAFAITGEPSQTYPPAVESLMLQAMDALHAKRDAEAEHLYRQAIALYPDAPELQNNLALAIANQGRVEESNAMAEVIFDEHPDYLFGQLSKAQKLIRSGDLVQARALIDPTLQRTQLHISELRMICRTQIEYFLAEHNAETADTWLNMWQEAEMDPEGTEEELMLWRLRIGFTRLMQRRRGPRKTTGGARAKRQTRAATTKPTMETTQAEPNAGPEKQRPARPAPRLLRANQDDNP